MSGRAGPPGAQARRRQRRWDGLESWRMKGVLTVLPSLIHLSLLLFAIGLCVFLWDVHYGVAIPVVLVTTIAAGAYFACTILPLIDRYCPYGTVLSRLYKQFSSEYSQSVRDGGKQDETTSRALHWMIVNCETPRSVDVALQSLAGAEHGLPHEILERCDTWSLIRQRMELINATGEESDLARLLYKRALESHLETRTSSGKLRHKQEGTEQLVTLVLGVQACINSIIYKALEQHRLLDSNISILEQCLLIGPRLLRFECDVNITDSRIYSEFPLSRFSLNDYSSYIRTNMQRSEAIAESLTQLLEQHMNGGIEMEPTQHAALCTSLVVLLSCKMATDSSVTVQYILRLIRAYSSQSNNIPEYTYIGIKGRDAADDLNQSTLALLLGAMAAINTSCFVKDSPCFSRPLLRLTTRSRMSMECVVELAWQYLLSIVYPGTSLFNTRYYMRHGGFHLLVKAKVYHLSLEDCTLVRGLMLEVNSSGYSHPDEPSNGCFAHHLQEFTNALTPNPDLDAIPFPLWTCLGILPHMVYKVKYLQPTPDSYVLTVKILSWDSKTEDVMRFYELMRYCPFPKASPRLIDLLSTSGVFTQLINLLEDEDTFRQAFAIGQIWLFFNMSIQAPDRTSDAMNKLETILLEYPGYKKELGGQEVVVDDLESRLSELLRHGDDFGHTWRGHRNIYLFRILELMLQQRCTPLFSRIAYVYELEDVAENLRGIKSFVNLEEEKLDQPCGDNADPGDLIPVGDDPPTTSPNA
ncbi:putative transmembrane protein [Rhizoctonia solani 123E]|uniref:Putative transmembrane protein n=1 Tax=Rhizoctonia solani 123E TaxID=1423351 RepID=A0A074RKY6_9AGAM|nr:putative transmembrane protein [Rhizoctonia solani 123E]